MHFGRQFQNTNELMPSNCGAGKYFYESPGQQEIQPVNLKGNQSSKLVRKADAEAEASVFWSSDQVS